jgi:hypothetical protein
MSFLDASMWDTKNLQIFRSQTAQLLITLLLLTDCGDRDQKISRFFMSLRKTPSQDMWV